MRYCNGASTRRDDKPYPTKPDTFTPSGALYSVSIIEKQSNISIHTHNHPPYYIDNKYSNTYAVQYRIHYHTNIILHFISCTHTYTYTTA